MILAGAGTGKTRVIAYRVAQLLRADPSLTPANILALTFSRKAADEMRERVEALIGTHPDEMSFYTFHGFCHRFLQDHSLELGLTARLRLLDKAEGWVFFRKLLPQLKLKHYGNLADPTGCIDGFLGVIGRAKDELVTPAEMAAYAGSLPDPKERESAEEVARVYAIYREQMKQTGSLDFGDLVTETICALKERPELLKRVRAQYKTVLVDEFQDTNVAQIELLKLLVGPEGNLCVVGDDDQAIYRFRGASFASFLLLKEAFPKVKVIKLTRNYRSTPTILSAADRLIRHNEPDRYDSEKKLHTDNPDGPPVEILVCQDERHEADVVTARLRELYEAQPASERRWANLAVLYRAHSHRDELVEALQRSGIPFSVRGGSKLMEQPAVRDLVALLQALWDSSDSVPFFRLLSHPVWAVPAEELMAVSRLAKETGLPISRVLESEGGAALPETVKKGMSQLRAELDGLRRQALRTGVDELVPQVIERSFLKVLFRLPAAPGTDAPTALSRFLRLTYQYAQNHPEENNLGAFLWYLDSVSRASADVYTEEEESELEDRVRLMTVHQAKGLEFDWVVLLEMVQGKFPGRNRSEAVPFPVELMKESLPKGDYHLQEERRLCYVACTRAKKGLILTTQDRSRKRPSVFVEEMKGQGQEERVVVRTAEISDESLRAGVPAGQAIPAGISPATLAEERELLELMERVRKTDPQDGAAFEQAVARIQELAARARGSAKREAPQRRALLNPNSKFSFSQLETFRYCGLKYLYSYVYRIPVRPTPIMLFGIDLHGCLENLYAAVIEEGKVAPLEELLAAFRRLHVPGRYGEPFKDKEFRELGEKILRDFYKKHEGAFGVPLFVERSFSLQIGDAVIHGVIDRVDPIEGGGVEIIDYKSGKVKEKAKPEEQLQLRLYALAAKEVFNLEPRKISFYYLQKNQALSFDQNRSDFEETRAQIEDLVKLVRKGDFTPDPSQHKCGICDFKSLCPASLA